MARLYSFKPLLLATLAFARRAATIHWPLSDFVTGTQRVNAHLLESPAFMLAAISFALMAQFLLDRYQALLAGASLFALAILAMTVALSRLRPTSVKPVDHLTVAPLHQYTLTRWTGRGLLLVGLAGMWFCAEQLTGLTFQVLDRIAFPFILLLTSSTCGLLLIEHWSPRAFVKGTWQRRWEYLLVLAILGFATYLRFERLDYYPPPNSISWIDEAQIGMSAQLIRSEGARPWQFPLLTYPTALAFSTLGDTTYALRVVPDVWGVLTLVVFYFLARELFAMPAALGSLFLFAISRWHIAFTRMVLPTTTSTFLAVAIFLLIVRGLRTRGGANFLWAGLLLGLGFYDYAAFKILPTFVLLLLVTRHVQDALSRTHRSQQTPRAFVRELLRTDQSMVLGYLLLAVGALITLTPFIALVQHEPAVALTERFSSILPGLFGTSGGPDGQAAIRNLQTLILFFNVRGEEWPAVNIPNAPMLDSISAALLVLAFGYCLLSFWRKDHLTLIIWFAVTLIGGGIFVGTIRSHRFAMVIPIIFLLIAALFDSLYHASRTLDLKRLAHSFVLKDATNLIVLLPLLTVAGLLPLAAFINYDLFYNQQIHRKDVRTEYDRADVSVANAIANLPDKPYVYLFEDWPFYTTSDLGWMAHMPRGRSAYSLMDVLAASDAPEGDVAYVFVDPFDDDTLSEVVQDAYPNARVEKFRAPVRDYSFSIVQVSQSERARYRPPTRGVRVSYFDDSRAAQPVISQLEPALTMTALPKPWQSAPLEALRGKPYAIQWDGRLQVPQTGQYRFRVQTMSGGALLLVDQKVVLQEPGRANERITREASLALGAGAHDLRVRYNSLGGEFALLEIRWTGPDGVERVIPPSAFNPN